MTIATTHHNHLEKPTGVLYGILANKLIVDTATLNTREFQPYSPNLILRLEWVRRKAPNAISSIRNSRRIFYSGGPTMPKKPTSTTKQPNSAPPAKPNASPTESIPDIDLSMHRDTDFPALITEAKRAELEDFFGRIAETERGLLLTFAAKSRADMIGFFLRNPSALPQIYKILGDHLSGLNVLASFAQDVCARLFVIGDIMGVDESTVAGKYYVPKSTTQPQKLVVIRGGKKGGNGRTEVAK